MSELNPLANDLIDTSIIARMLGVTRAWATSSITKQPGFPKPRINLSQRLRRWSREDVTKWVQKTSAKA
jgi:predicted DNA-binding transcriptional regulator AlpA